MNPAKLIQVSRNGDSLEFRPSDSASSSPVKILLDESAVIHVQETIPLMSRKESMDALSHLVPGHVPGCVEDYRFDAVKEGTEGGRIAYSMYFFRESDLSAVRSRYPLGILVAATKKGTTGELFPPKRKRPISYLIRSCLILILLAGMALIGVLRAERRYQERVTSETVTSNRANTEALNASKESLEYAYKDLENLENSLPRKSSNLIAAIAEASETDLEINRITVEGRTFQMQGYTNKPLELVERLEQHQGLFGIAVSEIRPTGTSNFITLEGSYSGL